MSSKGNSQSSPRHKNHQMCLAMTEELLKKEKKPLEIEEKLGITITMPQLCYFYKENIYKKYGLESDSLLFHSLDGIHDNWAPENKTPTHHGCHTKFHCSGEKSYWFGKDRSKTGMYGKRHTEESNRKNRDSCKKYWASLTPEQLTEHGRKTQEGRRKAKETRSKRMVCAVL